MVRPPASPFRRGGTLARPFWRGSGGHSGLSSLRRPTFQGRKVGKVPRGFGPGPPRCRPEAWRTLTGGQKPVCPGGPAPAVTAYLGRRPRQKRWRGPPGRATTGSAGCFGPYGLHAPIRGRNWVRPIPRCEKRNYYKLGGGSPWADRRTGRACQAHPSSRGFLVLRASENPTWPLTARPGSPEGRRVGIWDLLSQDPVPPHWGVFHHFLRKQKVGRRRLDKPGWPPDLVQNRRAHNVRPYRARWAIRLCNQKAMRSSR